MAVVSDIVQVTNSANKWFPCLVIVTEVKPWGVQGYTSVPLQGDAYIRLNEEEYEVVGKAVIVVGDLNDPN